eukprot:6118639-Pyramimonas_sp.AAC.2
MLSNGERSRRKWGTGHRVRKGEGCRGVCTLAVTGTGGPVKGENKRSNVITRLHPLQLSSPRPITAANMQNIPHPDLSDGIVTTGAEESARLKSEVEALRGSVEGGLGEAVKVTKIKADLEAAAAELVK